MTSYPAQYGFEAFSVPDYSLELAENEHYRFTILESEFENQWIEIYDLSFSDEPDENGESLLKFEFQSSLGEDNVAFNELAQKLIKEVIIRSMEHAMRNEKNEEQE